MGIKNAIIAVNKIDLYNAPVWFDEIKEKVLACMKKLRFNVDNVPVIPIMGLAGRNVTEWSDYMPWYEGPTLLEAIEKMEQNKMMANCEKKPLRLPIQSVTSIPGCGISSVGNSR